MKILHVITSLHTGGAEKLMLDLIPRLKEHGHQVDLLLFDGSDTPFLQEAKALGISVIDLGKGGSVYSPAKLLKLIPYLRKYDIIHTHNTAPQLFAAIGSVLCSVVLCTTEHNTSNRRRGWKWYASIDKWMYSRYRKIVCISDKTELNLREATDISDDRVITINNGIDVAKYAEAQSLEDMKKQYNCSIALMQVAGFRYQKDQDTVIKALSKLPDYVHLFLVGDGERRSDLEKIVTQLKLQERVHFMGIRTDVPSLLASSDIVIMSSHWEGFGLSAVEGMAVGKPVIASDVDGLREVVKGAGILFPHGDADALAKEVCRLAENPEVYAEVAKKCRERADMYDISTMADGYLKVYESLTTHKNH